MNTGQELADIYGNAGNVFGVALSPDGDKLSTAGVDGTIRTCTLRIDNLVALARSRLTSLLTDDEHHKYLHTGFCGNKKLRKVMSCGQPSQGL